MEAGARTIPDACFYGCPETDFAAMRQALEDHEQDLGVARAAGLSEAALKAISDLGCEIQDQVNKIADKIPADAARPWRPKTDELPREAAAVTPTIECCRLAG